MPRGGQRPGAGRPFGSGRFREPARNLRVPLSLVGPVSELLAQHQQAQAISFVRSKQPSSPHEPVIALPTPGKVAIYDPVDAIEMLGRLEAGKVRASAVVLDPLYRSKNSAGRAAFLSEVIPLITAASRVADHIFVWGFPESIARLVDHWPSHLRFQGWLTWYFRNAPNRSKSWRPSQQACLHLSRVDARIYPENFYPERQRALVTENKLEFKFTPYTVIEEDEPDSVFKEALMSGFIKKSEQTGFTYQKPECVIEPLLKMTTIPGDLVIDPTAGSGTTGSVATKLGCAAILSDRSGAAIRLCRKRLAGSLAVPMA